MPELMDHVAFLSQEIGPRPAGTEEEQQAALYITEQMQKDAGLSAVIEDFNSASNAETPRALCCAVTFVVALASLFLPVLAIPAMILTAISAILYAFEATGRPIVSRFLARGVSQNVVAKYEPGYSAEAGGARRRKVILVARYDSGKVRPELKAPILGVLPFIQWAVLVSIILVPLILIVRNFFFLHAEGTTAIVFYVIIGICLFFTALPLIVAIVHRFSAYNEAANANAAGTAVLLDVARRVGRGRVSASELEARAEADGTIIHGEEEAIASGLVPEGAKLAYEAAKVQPPEPAPQTPEDRLASAKAAIAALTGKPIPASEPVRDIASNLVQVKEAPIGQPTEDEIREQRDETREALTSIPAGVQAGADVADGQIQEAETAVDAQAGAVAAAGAAAGVAAVASASVQGGFAEVGALQPESDSSVPDWFRKAQENAKKPRTPQPGEIHRSRYADALDAAVTESTSHFEQANRIVDAETEQRIRQMREGIMEPRTVQDAAGQPDSSNADRTEAASTAFDAASPAQAGSVSDASMPDGMRVPDEPWTSGPVSAADSVQQQPVGGAPGSTTAMPPIDVSDLRAQVAELQKPEVDSEQSKPAIVLPDIGLSAATLPPVIETGKQRAPLAEAEQSTKVAAKSLLTMLPSIGADEIAAEKDGKDPAQVHQESSAAAKPDLRALPSLSGEIRKTDSGDDAVQATGSVSKAGSFASMGMTGTFAPVGDELIENVDPDDIYVDDADDSDYMGGITETGAFAGPGYVEMPKSRVRRFFDRFGKKNKQEEVSPQEWLDVDEDFEARSVGAARGSWESFQQESFDETDGYSEYDELDEDEAFDGSRGIDDFDDDDFGSGKRTWQGGAFSRRRLVNQGEEADEGDGSAYLQSSPDPQVSEELQQVYQFRHPDVNVEVWFVALGSELSGNAGIKAFLAEHGTELRGSVIINLDALGAGDLSLIEKEGKFRRVSASSRMKRYMKKASQATGVEFSTAPIAWTESASSVALRHGFQAMSIAGMDGSKPAFFAQGDDVLENVDPDTLYRNSDFVMELLKNI